MRVEYSARAETELDDILTDGINRFGRRVAEATLQRLDRVLNVTLAAQPYLGRFFPGREVYRLVIAGTPFVAFYHVDSAIQRITIVAVFHGRQDRSEFEGAP